MHNEIIDLAHTLAWTTNAIAQADMSERIRIAAAYREAQCVVAGIEPERDSRRPRILACFARFTPLQDAEDKAACGWMLAAIQERVMEHDLPGWEELDRLVGSTVKLLQYGAPRLH